MSKIKRRAQRLTTPDAPRRPSTAHVSSRSWRYALAFGVALAWTPPIVAQSEPPSRVQAPDADKAQGEGSELQALMQRVAKALQAAEADTTAVKARRDLREAASAITLRRFASASRAQERGALARHLDKLRQSAESLGALPAKVSNELASESLDALRRTCIQCHARFRSGQQRRLYPSRSAALTGRVRIVARDGKERKKHGGVVVFLDGVNGKTKPPLLKARMTQKNRRFDPPILPILAGTAVEFPNNDRILHNVFSLSRAKPFDLEIYGSGETKSVRFAKTGLIKVYCHIHPEMVAHILVLANRHFAVTDDDGFWCIPDLPEGDYVLRSWHEFGGGSQRKLRVSGKGVIRVDTRVRESKKRVPHRNKFGRPYRRKYGK